MIKATLTLVREPAATAEAVVAVHDVKVTFGAVKALDGVDLEIRQGECLGLVGHNGAGKSTIVNVINGGLTSHQGRLTYMGTDVTRPGIAAAHGNGIRSVFQELSLCPNLSVVENTRIMHRNLVGTGWRRRAGLVIAQSLDTIFPGHGIDATLSVSDLSIAERQMVEIAIAFADAGGRPRLVILDEPTSSLDAGLASQLMTYVRTFVAGGGSVLLISHILGEILSTSDRIVVMKDGRVVADRPAADFDHKGLVQAMGNVIREQAARATDTGTSTADILVSLPPRNGIGLKFSARRGEIIGLAGLGGHGQTDLLVDLYLKLSRHWLPGGSGDVAFVAGDRALNGIFPLWSILKNLSIASLAGLTRAGLISPDLEGVLGKSWKDRIEIRTPDLGNKILSLSGGNQQKVLFARALATSARLVLMDDPMRGVDIGTKQEVYSILQSEAANGRSFVWYSTEMDEICLCDRVFVFRESAIVAELTGDMIREDAVLSASFSAGAA